jgi:hypothetical protein
VGKAMNDLSVIYYTSNWLDEHNPYFLENTRKQLLYAIGDLPMVIVSQKPTLFGKNSINVCIGDVGRSHLNIYRQILAGCKAAKTAYVALAEDDILYSREHFHSKVPNGDYFLYDMNKLSLFTWTKPPLFSFRHNRMVVNQLIAPRQYLIDAMEERFAKFPDESKIPLKSWGDPGRYENYLGVTVRKTDTFMSTCPSIVFTHPQAYGYLNHGKKKRLGDLRIIEVPYWGKAEQVLKLWGDQPYV